eukprot:CAMPEP_0181190092 /NCGR_PEP_ID=MMETSP1096-20121128/12006_1 /TAXON_ID=156174 ORGANISM="Chrysochromulina ericina, Strain CCMP281" /NCGR_SAMPLE_ID=MMETSP1096 /ASSEMBLY_ACC=CAM_ASM_000453 /LENGTH=64 /DNA_ID=CAMNT_0023279279 /DNA_START=419 /DNA_END=613 /DNA_ORIENTATION=-
MQQDLVVERVVATAAAAVVGAGNEPTVGEEEEGVAWGVARAGLRVAAVGLRVLVKEMASPEVGV